jgi:hypothetical protein
MNRLRSIAGGLAIGSALLLAGCGSGGPNPDGPFGNSAPSSRFGECLTVPPGQVATIGATEWPNPGPTARVTGVTLVKEHDLRLLADWVVPITGNDLLGVLIGYPPYGVNGRKGPPGAQPGVEWNRRQRAVGATIPHTRGQDVYNLVLLLQPTGHEGSVKDVYVDYQTGGTQYRYDMHFNIEVYSSTTSGCPAPRG